jgi:hypothetical protein
VRRFSDRRFTLRSPEIDWFQQATDPVCPLTANDSNITKVPEGLTALESLKFASCMQFQPNWLPASGSNLRCL